MKPLLLWPKPRSAIATHLGRPADDFTLVDTDYAGELSKLYKLRPDTLIFDPFPTYGQHYQAFLNHVTASGCRYHVVGLEKCQHVLQTMKHPSLSSASIEEILLALGYLDRKR